MTSAALPEVWNDGEDLVYTYHGAQYNDTTLCEIAPFVLNHLADRNTYWNETIMRSFVTALDYHLNTNIPSVGSYFLISISLPLFHATLTSRIERSSCVKDIFIRR